MQIKATQCERMLIKYIRAQLVPMIWGSPGIGKSSIVRSIAKQFNLFMIDLRLSQSDPTDLNGLPWVSNGRSGYNPMDTFPIEGDKIPEGYSGWLLFLDEFNSAPQAVQAAAYKLILDRQVGKYHLHKNVAIVCAGNQETDNAITNPISTAMQSRLAHIELTVDNTEFLEWCWANGIDRRITSYLQFRPKHVYAFNADHTDKTYACNRTWEFVDRIIKVTEDNDPDRLAMFTGVISEGVAREFVGFCKIEQDLPKIKQILEAPESLRVPQEPSVLFALSGSVAEHVSDANIEKLFRFIKRMPREFQVVTARQAVKRNMKLLQNEVIRDWYSELAGEIL